MNILVFTTSKSSVNTLRPVGEMFINFAKRGHRVTIITERDTPYGRRYEENGIHVIDWAPKRKICLDSIKLIRAELKRQPYDVLYATNSKTIPSAAFAAMGSNVKFVTYRGTTGGLYRHDPTAYLTHLHPRVNGIVCVSDEVNKDVSQQVWGSKVKVRTIHKGHELAWYQESPADLGQFGIGADKFVLICAVNARPSKGIPVMLEAARQLADLPDLHLLLVGNGMDAYQELIDKSGMKERIHLAGYRRDAPELIVASSVLVQPSISGEGLPRAVMEAMSYGTPCICTTTGGGKEVIEHGKSGFIVPTRDPGAIEQCVRQLYNDRDALHRMAEAGKARISQSFTCEMSTQKHLDFFTELMDA